MALSATEIHRNGFVRSTVDDSLVLTTDATGATWQLGELRDPDGRLVVSVA